MLYLYSNKLNLKWKGWNWNFSQVAVCFQSQKAQLLWVNLVKYDKVSHLNKNISPKTNESEWESESSSLAISKTFKTFKTKK